MRYLIFTAILICTVLAPALSFAKDFKTPIVVEVVHSKPVADLVEGDFVETTIQFMPLQDIQNLHVNIFKAGVELFDAKDQVDFPDLKQGVPVELKIRLKVETAGGSISINYFTKTVFGTSGGALKICCYGTKQ